MNNAPTSPLPWIEFTHNGYTYRTTRDAKIVEGRDGLAWNRTYSGLVRDAALAAILKTGSLAAAITDPAPNFNQSASMSSETFISRGFTVGICAGCQKVLDADYSGHVRGTSIVERGSVTIRICKDRRITDERFRRSVRLGCLKLLGKRLVSQPGPDVEGIAKAEIERVLAIYLLAVTRARGGNP